MGKFLSLITITYLLVGCQSKIDFSIKESKSLFESQGLTNVECALYDEKNQIFYITNGLNYAPGTDGFISKASVDGKSLELKWVTNLNRPTGMALKGNTLYVADLSVLLGINTETGAIVERFNEPIHGSALNDVTIDSDGIIYVSASGIGGIFKLMDEGLELWVQDTLQLKYANGLMAREDQIMVGGLSLSSIDIRSGEIRALTTTPVITDFEGLVSDGKDGYFMTVVGQGTLFHVTKNLEAASLLMEEDYLGDLTYDQRSNTLFIPRGNGNTGEFYISSVELNR